MNNLNALEGRIIIRISDKPRSCEVVSSRPLLASRILTGKTADEALAVIPLLFNVCGMAQAYAAHKAISTGMTQTHSQAVQAARELVVLAETGRENLLRVFMDWPLLFQMERWCGNLHYLAQLHKDFAAALFKNGDAFSLTAILKSDILAIQALISEFEDFLSDHVFKTSPNQWLGFNQAQLMSWAADSDTIASRSVHQIIENNWQSAGAVDYCGLPELNADALTERLDAEDADDFIAFPDWQGSCFETSAYSRQYRQPLVQSLTETFSTGLLARWVARLVELAQIPRQMRQWLELLEQTTLTAPQSSANGLGIVEAARGRLIHRVKMQQGIVKQYQILAPTEWNFHPKGVLFRSLLSVEEEKADRRQQVMHLLIHAFDPCVGYQLELS